MDFTYECNLKCKMCYQRNLYTKTRFPRFFIDEFIDKRYYLHAGEIALVGGEPLVIPESINFMQRLAEIGPGECQLLLSTNGLLLDKFWEDIRAFKRVLFAISLDSCDPKTYESIRIRAKWDTIQAILDKIEHTISSEPWRAWKVIFGNLIMKSTITQLPQMLRFGYEHKFANRFGLIEGPQHTDENIFVHNWLLDSMPMWKGTLESSVEIADKFCSDYPTKQNLMGIRQLLLTKPWVTRSRAYLTHRLFGERGLGYIYRDKISRCLSSSAKISMASRLLLTIEKSEGRYKDNLFVWLLWSSFAYPMFLTIVSVISNRYLALAIYRFLRLSQIIKEKYYYRRMTK